MIAVAIAVFRENVKTPAFIDGTRAIADAAFIRGAHARVRPVTEVVSIQVLKTVSIAIPFGIRVEAVRIWVVGARKAEFGDELDV